MSRLTQVQIRPAALEQGAAAAFLALSNSTFERLTREDASFPKPRQLSDRRVCYLVRELEAWLESRPVSSVLPPANTSRRGARCGGWTVQDSGAEEN
jgi:prophage regulatory protein